MTTMWSVCCFYMLTCYLCIFFGEVSAKVCGSVFNQVVYFLIVEL